MTSADAGTGVTYLTGQIVGFGKIAFLFMFWIGEISGTSAAIATIPQQYRPKAKQTIMHMVKQGTDNNNPLSTGAAYFNTNGTITDASTNGKKINGTICGMIVLP